MSGDLLVGSPRYNSRALLNSLGKSRVLRCPIEDGKLPHGTLPVLLILWKLCWVFEASKKKQPALFLQEKLQHLLADCLKEKLWSEFFS